MYVLVILKAFLDRETYMLYRNYINKKEFGKELQVVLGCIDNWYKENTTNPTVVDIATMVAMVSKDTYYDTMFETLNKITVPNSVVQLLEKYKESVLLEKLSVGAYEAMEGSRPLTDVFTIVEQIKNPQTIGEVSYVTDDLEEILQGTIKEPGLRWRLNFLNRSLGSLRPGDFGFIFARPETGKTTLLASEITHMAHQAHQRNLGPVLWFNNEEQGRKVKLRTYQGALGVSLTALLGETQKHKEKYLNLVGNKLKLRDSASISRQEIESIVDKEKPSLIVLDQIDKVKGFKADREDLALGAIYQWSRELAKAYAPIVGVCQADATAEGERWLNMAHVANAKTAKQAEADFILGIGKVQDPGFEHIRFLNISKNKLTGDQDTEEALRHGRAEVKIIPTIARFEDL